MEFYHVIVDFSPKLLNRSRLLRTFLNFIQTKKYKIGIALSLLFHWVRSGMTNELFATLSKGQHSPGGTPILTGARMLVVLHRG